MKHSIGCHTGSSHERDLMRDDVAISIPEVFSAVTVEEMSLPSTPCHGPMIHPVAIIPIVPLILRSIFAAYGESVGKQYGSSPRSEWIVDSDDLYEGSMWSL
jgi:hypothetical protein